MFNENPDHRLALVGYETNVKDYNVVPFTDNQYQLFTMRSEEHTSELQSH